MRILILTWRDLAHSAAGGAEVYTEQVARRWVDAGHEVTLFAATVPGRPNEETVDGYRVVRRGGRLTVYRAARRWYRENGIGQYDVVIDMVNTVPFKAHEWITDTPVIAFFHQTAEECWHFNSPLPVAVLGRYILEPQWIRSYRGRRVMVVSQSTADAARPLRRARHRDPARGLRACRRAGRREGGAAHRGLVRPAGALQATAGRRRGRPDRPRADPGPPGLDHGRRTDARRAPQAWHPQGWRSSAAWTRMTRSSGWRGPTSTSPRALGRAGVSS